uniref:VWFD domain-containing protein n=1 Tax=Amphora coffeiformis TaxID=265554 RepID=A0A6S8J5J6_9STRA
MGCITSTPAANNMCTDAIPLNPAGGGTVFTIGDTFTAPIIIDPEDGTNCVPLIPVAEPGAPICQDINPNLGFLPQARYGVWYTLTVEKACEVSITLETCDTEPTTTFIGTEYDLDTAIAVYKGECGSLECVGGADDTCGPGSVFTSLDLSELSVDGTETYYVLVYSGNDALDGNFGRGSFTLTGTVSGTSTSSCGGDPHFARWHHETRDSFHGECDLVLLHSDAFHNKAGLDVHVRTTMMDNDLSYSYVEAAAVRIGKTVLEFHPKFFRVNGVDHDYESVPSFEFDEQDHTYKISSTSVGKHKRDTILKLNAHSGIKIRSTKDLMYVTFDGGYADFWDSVGMLGNYTTGEMYGRSGPFKEDYVHYGMEWQVNPSQNDPILFSDHRDPQLPYERCRLPVVESAATQRRRLRSMDMELKAKAMAACQNAKTDFDLCVDDVMATGDVDVAEAFVDMV